MTGCYISIQETLFSFPLNFKKQTNKKLKTIKQSSWGGNMKSSEKQSRDKKGQKRKAIEVWKEWVWFFSSFNQILIRQHEAGFIHSFLLFYLWNKKGQTFQIKISLSFKTGRKPDKGASVSCAPPLIRPFKSVFSFLCYELILVVSPIQ